MRESDARPNDWFFPVISNHDQKYVSSSNFHKIKMYKDRPMCHNIKPINRFDCQVPRDVKIYSHF